MSKILHDVEGVWGGGGGGENIKHFYPFKTVLN